ncbi:MAG TPA: N-acetylmuramoyl-L-alanine amidase [Hyphomicrobiaceae bacterium]|nr:N-acetylmuramoyl-L-alanine amidase [Hyphomicrobiaceae bacterium]
MLGFGADALAQTEIPKTRRVVSPAEVTIEKPATKTDADSGPAVKSDPDRENRPPVHREQKSVVTGLFVSASGGTTTVTLSSTAAFQPTVFTLANPYRVIVDLPNVDFQLPASVARQVAGQVKAVRFGLMAPGRARLVMDVDRPVRVTATLSPVAQGSSVVRYTLALVPTTPEAFAAQSRSEPAETAPVPEASRSAAERAPGKPVVMIDPGHGGVDGGASGPGSEQEKDIVLAVALELRNRLQAAGRYDVRMTRTDDRFVSLDQRVEMSAKVGADLFVSIHADAVPDGVLADAVHGATVYTLSEQASSFAAQRLADKENAADANAGVSLVSAGNEQIDSILSDLVARETKNFSLRFRSLLTSRLAAQRLVSREPARSAAFRVLRQPQTPSVLVELGFMTNPEEVRQMQSSAWRQQVARALASAVDAYFSETKAR